MENLVSTIASVVGAVIALYGLRPGWGWRRHRDAFAASALIASSVVILLTSLKSVVSTTAWFLQFFGLCLAVTAGYFAARWRWQRTILVFGPNFKAGGYIPGYYDFMKKAIDDANDEIIITGSGFDLGSPPRAAAWGYERPPRPGLRTEDPF